MIKARRIDFLVSVFSTFSRKGLKSNFHRVLIPFGFAMFLFLQPSAGSDCSSNTVYLGYVSGEIEMWKRGMTELQEAYDRTAEPCLLLALTEARYGYIGYLLGLNRKEEAKPLVESFETDIGRLAVFPQYKADTEAFRVAQLGFRMELNPAKAITLGTRALKQLELAVATDSTSPAVWIEKANAEASMPAFAGGSKEKAAASFREALRLFEADTSLSASSWRYLNTIVLLGQTLEKLEDYSGARQTYLKALAIEPGLRRVSNELLPAVELKLK
jgi:tetratricopeptide (TPR) repeat protein